MHITSTDNILSIDTFFSFFIYNPHIVFHWMGRSNFQFHSHIYVYEMLTSMSPNYLLWNVIFMKEKYYLFQYSVWLAL